MPHQENKFATKKRYKKKSGPNGNNVEIGHNIVKRCINSPIKIADIVSLLNIYDINDICVAMTKGQYENIISSYKRITHGEELPPYFLFNFIGILNDLDSPRHNLDDIKSQVMYQAVETKEKVFQAYKASLESTSNEYYSNFEKNVKKYLSKGTGIAAVILSVMIRNFLSKQFEAFLKTPYEALKEIAPAITETASNAIAEFASEIAPGFKEAFKVDNKEIYKTVSKKTGSALDHTMGGPLRKKHDNEVKNKIADDVAKLTNHLDNIIENVIEIINNYKNNGKRCKIVGRSELPLIAFVTEVNRRGKITEIYIPNIGNVGYVTKTDEKGIISTTEKHNINIVGSQFVIPNIVDPEVSGKMIRYYHEDNIITDLSDSKLEEEIADAMREVHANNNGEQ
ncbi:hypothetical protein FE392_15365 [Xenorhabdus sp. 12]|uniref:Uncharacterized protein n=1 Tax=Xenorhabdus santafensis TaxID=2582833 RepID=A0ABU4SD32_9GAMM|nr:hypothetical protein [Xenorhabdus sp. 12]MDX7988693.1 hypothetical protein [Xenorhabdus sp. 12]